MYVCVSSCMQCTLYTVCTPIQNTLHLVDHGTGGPLRCNRCKTYMNPFVRFVDGGRQYICPICQCSNEGEDACIHVHVHCIIQCICTCTCTQTHNAYPHTYSNAPTHTDTHTHMHKSTCTHVRYCIHVHPYTHTYIHTHLRRVIHVVLPSPSSSVPQEYFCHLDHKGMRTDIASRPELTFGSVEYKATVDYCKVHTCTHVQCTSNAHLRIHVYMYCVWIHMNNPHAHTVHTH